MDEFFSAIATPLSIILWSVAIIGPLAMLFGILNLIMNEID